MKQYSVDLRERLLGAIDAGLSQAEAARLLGVGTATIERWRRRRRETRQRGPALRGGAGPGASPAAGAALRAQVRGQPDATLAEHGARWEAAQGVRLSAATMSRSLARLGWPLKKSPGPPASGTRLPGPPGGVEAAALDPAAASCLSTRAARTPA